MSAQGVPPDSPRTIDAHNHMGGYSSADSYDVDADITRRLGILDARGVDQAVIIAPHKYLRPDGIADTRRINDTVAAYRDRRPDRFPAAVGVVEPTYGPRGLDELSRCADDLGFAGISFHTRFQGVANNDPWVRRYVERMGELGLVPFIHSLAEAPEEALWKIAALATDLPDITILVLDSFGTFEQSQQVAEFAERCPNMMFDTATSHGWGFMAPLVARCGASRLVYSSDLYSSESPYMYDPLPDILAADLTADERAAILGGNIASLLGLPRQPTSK